MPCVVIGNVVFVVPMIEPAQLSVAVGAVTIGKVEVGGGSQLDGDITAYNYVREFIWRSDKWEFTEAQYEPANIGWFTVSQEEYRDIRDKGQKVASKYYKNRKIGQYN